MDVRSNINKNRNPFLKKERERMRKKHHLKSDDGQDI